MKTIFPHTILVLAGPTAVGKTAVAIALAQKLNTVILSADSRQCYQELNIGVARPTPQELVAVEHYFVNSHSIHEKIDAAFYESYAISLLSHLFQKHPVVVVTGGTGLYIKALTEGLDAIPSVPPAIREEVRKNYQDKGLKWLQEQLIRKDRLFSVHGEMQNPQRMMRALEVMEATGNSILSFRTSKKTPRHFNVVQIGLEMPRSLLYEKINARVDQMIAAGLEAEARELDAFRHLNALQTVGYKEFFEYFDGTTTLVQAIEQLKQNTRHYAKRQMTWFKKQPGFYWINTAEVSNPTAAILDFLEGQMRL